MLTKFFESLNFKDGMKTYHIEMITEVQEYFKEQKNLCIVFVLEDIDFYIEWSKQHMLYKILDMLQYANIPFIFIATSQKVDIIDSFEKRIKSRFSQRQIFFYDDDFTTFHRMVVQHLEQHFRPPEETVNVPEGYKDEQQDHKSAYNNLKHTLESAEAQDFLRSLFDSGKSFEYMIQQLKIAICMIEQQVFLISRQTEDQSETVLHLEFDHYYRKKSKQAFEALQQQIIEQGDPGIIIKNLPRSNVEVLIFAFKVSKKASIFNFEAVYQQYKRWQMNFKQTQQASTADMSRQTFLKIFLDLVSQGFLKSENSADVLSVNNKVALGFR